MSYKHITLNDRNKIEVLKQEGYSSRRIAKILGFHHSTISRELKRCNNIYSAVEANKDRQKEQRLLGYFYWNEIKVLCGITNER